MVPSPHSRSSLYFDAAVLRFEVSVRDCASQLFGRGERVKGLLIIGFRQHDGNSSPPMRRNPIDTASQPFLQACAELPKYLVAAACPSVSLTFLK